jgi:hypothetical protein
MIRSGISVKIVNTKTFLDGRTAIVQRQHEHYRGEWWVKFQSLKEFVLFGETELEELPGLAACPAAQREGLNAILGEVDWQVERLLDAEVKRGE